MAASHHKTELAPIVDRMFHAWLARMTLGLSPAALMKAYLDWLIHLSISPGKQVELLQKAARKAARFSLYAGTEALKPDASDCIGPLPQDNRFQDPAWREWPFNCIHQFFLLTQQWWYNATTGIAGVTGHHEDMLFFTARQFLDVYSPSNFLFTNPVALKTTFEAAGVNLVRGWFNFIEDSERTIAGKGPAGIEEFQVGKNIAVSPGEVVYRNRLMELIQYRPSTETVWQEPVLFIPAWIMKYYILDLSPDNSLVKFLVDQGHPVFMVSWKNPGPADRDLDMNDYRNLGIMDALNTVSAIIPDAQIHAAGYCLGGTLLAIAVAAMARDGDERLKTVTLLAAQTDFTEAGELMVFMDESQIQYLEDMMWEQGYLDTKQMAGAFQLLRSNDLIWSAMIHDYLLGERRMMNDLMAWNTDATRIPYRMHSEYLRSLYLNDDLSEGRYQVGGRPINLADIRLPLFAVGTLKDHVAPWRSVYKIHMLTNSEELTFVLTSGGHNAGIVSEPGHRGRSYQAATHLPGEKHADSETWLIKTPKQRGSWWPLWESWLARHSSEQVVPPAIGATEKGYVSLCAAPGTYVFGK